VIIAEATQSPWDATPEHVCGVILMVIGCLGYFALRWRAYIQLKQEISGKIFSK
jgi:hypothetical protein